MSVVIVCYSVLSFGAGRSSGVGDSCCWGWSDVGSLFPPTCCCEENGWCKHFGQKPDNRFECHFATMTENDKLWCRASKDHGTSLFLATTSTHETHGNHPAFPSTCSDTQVMESHGCRQAHKTQDSYHIALNPINLYARACLHCSPPARWGLLDFKSWFRVLLLPPPSSFLLLASSSTASSRLVWASPDLNRRESKPCGPRRTSTGEIRSAVGFAGPQPARFWAQWASPDLNA